MTSIGYNSPINRLARLVHSVDSRDKFFAMFIAHYDWSGQYHSEKKVEADGEVLSLGTYIASAEQWDEFEVRWKAVLKKKNIPVMHITDFRKTSKSWPANETKEFLNELATIIRETTVRGFYAACLVRDYIEIVEQHVPTKTLKWVHGRWKKERMPYLFLLHYCLMWMRDKTELPPGEKISLIFEDDQRLSYAVKTFSEALISGFGWTDRYEIPVNFRPKGNPHALESADILAFIARNNAGHQFFGQPIHPWPESLNRSSLGRVSGGLLDRECFQVYQQMYSGSDMLSEIDSIIENELGSDA